jgi:Tol biopolymer transport system component
VLGDDGSGVRVLGGSVPIEHAWSPDGSQVVYGCGKWRDNFRLSKFWAAVCILDVESGETRQILEPPGPQSVPSVGALAWAPDGNTIVALVDSDVESDLYVFDASGQGWRALAQPGRESDPAWSPDGEIVYMSQPEDVEGSPRRAMRLWLMNADGSEAQPLFDDGAEPDWTAY